MATASSALAFRNARRKARLADRARRNTAHLENATAQDSSEKINRITITALGKGPELSTRSQRLNCRNSPPTCGSINQAPFHSPHNHDIVPQFRIGKKQNSVTQLSLWD